MHFSITETSLISEWIEQRSEGEVNLGVLSIAMDGRKVLRDNVKEAGNVESKYNRPHTTALGDSTVQIEVVRSLITDKHTLFATRQK